MKYQGKAIELIATKEIFGQKIATIKILETNQFKEIAEGEIQHQQRSLSFSHIRFAAIAAKMKHEVAQKSILAPYESSLIPLPHQILVLEKVMNSHQNRFLLADEVGMGKTIETGLILKELKLRGEIDRILIIVPKSSMLQWQSELKEHFNETFHIYDSEIISSMARTFANLNGDKEFNLWEQHDQIIVSTDALKPLEKRQGWDQERIAQYNKYRMDAVVNANFDMVIIDEAHKMGGVSNTVSRYRLADALANAIENVLLLTATPHRGKADHFRRILQLLDPDAFAGEGLPTIEELQPYVIRTEKRLAIDYEGKKLFNERRTHRLTVLLDPNRHQKQIALYNEVTDYVRRGFNAAKRSKKQATGLMMVLFQRLLSSSTEALLSAMEGRLHRLRYDSELEIETLAGDLDIELDHIDDLIQWEGVRNETSDTIVDEEQLLCTIIEQAKECRDSEIDAKTEALKNKIIELQQTSGNPKVKVLVFTEFRTTQKMLASFLQNNGYACTTINGTQDLDERKNALAKFRDEVQILIATDAAGESLNMQFANIIINYDLPWNPMMIEQRIGRVDRIGQQKQVEAFNLLTNNSVDLRVYEVIEEKLNNIIDQLGIDKTSDVLDSAIDMKEVNRLYLQSLLDPSRFEQKGNLWLKEIRSKLKEYQSTEGVLPEIEETEIDVRKAAEVKQSPLPIWMEELIIEEAHAEDRIVQRLENGAVEISSPSGSTTKVSANTDVVLNDPAVDAITLQHPTVKKLLANLGEYDRENGIAVLTSDEEETAGFWSLWEISAHNSLESKTCYQATFVADNGKQYTAYANDVWNRLVANDSKFQIENTRPFSEYEHINSIASPFLFTAYSNMEESLRNKIETKRSNKQKAFAFKRNRISRLGIENIKQSRLKHLESEQKEWEVEFNYNDSIIPKQKHLFTFRLEEKDASKS